MTFCFDWSLEPYFEGLQSFKIEDIHRFQVQKTYDILQRKGTAPSPSSDRPFFCEDLACCLLISRPVYVSQQAKWGSPSGEV